MEAIRTCHRCGNTYTGYHCNSPRCRAARLMRNEAARKRRRANGGRGKLAARSAGRFAWGTLASGPLPVHPDACPKQICDEPIVSMSEEHIRHGQA